ncbi:MAG: hypothetical protein ACYTDU_09995 [Planctomycetota bacterium]|jgi:hypothetical protein
MDLKDRKPPRTLPVVYFGFAHVALLTAFFLVATRPNAIAGFFYHPRMFAVVHLVTLGWITGTILGATYVVGPMALRTPIRAGWIDAVACGAYILGVAGVIAHFWIETYWGVATSGVLLLPALVCVAVRTWRALGQGAAPRPVKWHIGLAFANLLLAAAFGLALAINRESSFLAGNQLRNVFAHVHVAGVGWATMMFCGVGYRFLAMLFPAAPPGDKPVWVSLILFETGVLGLAATLPMQSDWARLFALVTAAAVAFFLGIIGWMLRHPRPPPAKLERPDLGVVQTLLALLYLAVASGVGLFLVFSREWQLPWIMVYGVCGLVGFLAQVVVGVGMRLFPAFAFREAHVVHMFGGAPNPRHPTSPHEMGRRTLQLVALVLWTPGVPLLAAGLALDHEATLVGGARALLLATLAVTVNNVLVVRHAFARPLQ